jgi:hypothetical protein
LFSVSGATAASQEPSHFCADCLSGSVSGLQFFLAAELDSFDPYCFSSPTFPISLVARPLWRALLVVFPGLIESRYSAPASLFSVSNTVTRYFCLCLVDSTAGPSHHSIFCAARSVPRFFDSCLSWLPGSVRRLAHVRPPAQTPARLPLCRFFLGKQRAKSQSWSTFLVVSVELLPSPSSVSVGCWSTLVA